MKQAKYMCPLCKKEENPTVKRGESWNKCPICERSFSNKELKGWEIGRIDFIQYWKERSLNAIESQKSYHVAEEVEARKDVDSQMNNIVQEDTDNLMHEIIMIKICNKEKKKQPQATLPEITAVKDKIDEIFDIILGR